MDERPGSTNPTMVQLDGLRGLAALAVVVQHTWNGNPITRAALGSAGVRLFFVLSGFLITGILLRARDRVGAGSGTTGGVLRAFYARRALRIFPLYYAAIALAWAVNLPTIRESIAWHLAYLTNVEQAWAGALHGPFSAHWSLAVEEQFYVLWPFAVLLLPTRRLRPILLGCLAAGPLSRWAILAWTGNGVAPNVLLPSCLDTLAAGALLAIRRRDRVDDEPVPGRLLAIGLILLVALLGLKFAQAGEGARIVLNDTAWMLASCWLIDRAARGFRGPARLVLESRAVVGLGTISYGIYVYHNLVIQLGRGWLPASGPTNFLIVLAVTIPAALVSYHGFEAPLNRLKARFPYTPSGDPHSIRAATDRRSGSIEWTAAIG